MFWRVLREGPLEALSRIASSEGAAKQRECLCSDGAGAPGCGNKRLPPGDRKSNGRDLVDGPRMVVRT